MKLLYLALMLSVLALVAVAGAVYFHVRRHMRMRASDAALRNVLGQIEEELKIKKR